MTDDLRKCDDCKEHSGVLSTLGSHDRLIVKLETHMEEQTKRGIRIYIGIILCLVTGITGICMNFNTQKNTTSIMVKERPNGNYYYNGNIGVNAGITDYGWIYK